MSAGADALLARTLARMAAADHRRLVAGESHPVPAELIGDETWMSEQVRLRGLMWGTDDRRVLATLWWYSASACLIAPAVASLAVTGEVLSPRLADLRLHWRPSSRLTGATSAAVLDGPDPLAALGAALRDTMGAAIAAAAAAGGLRERPLWAIATDAIADGLLWAGRSYGQVERAVALAAPLVAAIGARMPAPSYEEITLPGGSRLVTHRASCCLLYRAPGQDACGSCPRRPAEERLVMLRAADER
jgi:ferric iron reductase protein FhuF